MFGSTAPYLMAIAMMLFSGLSALTLMYAIDHLDPPEATTSAAPKSETVAV